MTEHTQPRENRLHLFILDVLRRDLENVQSLLNMLNDDTSIGWRDFWPRDFSEAEVVPALNDLARDGLIKQLVEQGGELVEKQQSVVLVSGEEAVWFQITRRGLDVWNAWRPPTVDEKT